jgi:hypothetical protein
MSVIDTLAHKSAPYLIYFIPFRVYRLFDDFGSEELITELKDPIRVRLSFYHTTQKRVLPHQVLCFQKVNPQNALHQTHTHYMIEILSVHMYVKRVYVCACHLWHREAESGNLCIVYKWNSDFVWQHKKTVYDILNNTVTQTTVRER